MANIPDRIGGQNVIKVLSNVNSSTTKLVDLSDVDASSLADGYILEYNADSSNFITTDSIRFLRNVNVTGITTTFELDVLGIATFRDNVNIGAELDVLGVSTFRDDLFVGGELDVLGVSTFRDDLFVGGELDVLGVSTFRDNVNLKEYLIYDQYFDGPNGIGYFDNDGKLIGAASTENAIDTSNFILTTVEPTGIPTWTSIIDGGEY